MDPFKLRNLGRSGLLVPQMGFGGAPLGDIFWFLKTVDSADQLKYFFLPKEHRNNSDYDKWTKRYLTSNLFFLQ